MIYVIFSLLYLGLRGALLAHIYLKSISKDARMELPLINYKNNDAIFLSCHPN